MRKKPSEAYLEKARLLTREEAERLMSRMRARSMCMMHDEEPSTLECVAIQLETEDEQLREWRAKMVELRKKERRLGV
jgi:DNA primase